MKIDFIIIILIVCSTINCNQKKCEFNNYFFSDKNVDTPKLKIVTKNCNDYLFTGSVLYKSKNYEIAQNFKVIDSAFFYAGKNKSIVFDFSNAKRTGHLRVGDGITINYLMDIKENETIFRLFHIPNIGKYYSGEVSHVLIIGYNQGIVGEFLMIEKNNGKYGYTDFRGYKPNEKYFDSILDAIVLM